jgi:hypothetical protein
MCGCSTSSVSEKTYAPRLIMKSSRKADCSVRINAASPLHDRCQQIKTNGSNRGHRLDFVNPSTEPATYETGIADVVQGLGSTTNHVPLPAPNHDVKNALTPFTSIPSVTFHVESTTKEENHEYSRTVRYGLRSKKWHRCVKSRHLGVTRSLHRNLSPCRHRAISRAPWC